MIHFDRHFETCFFDFVSNEIKFGSQNISKSQYTIQKPISFLMNVASRWVIKDPLFVSNQSVLMNMLKQSSVKSIDFGVCHSGIDGINAWTHSYPKLAEATHCKMEALIGKWISWLPSLSYKLQNIKYLEFSWSMELYEEEIKQTLPQIAYDIDTYFPHLLVLKLSTNRTFSKYDEPIMHGFNIKSKCIEFIHLNICNFFVDLSECTNLIGMFVTSQDNLIGCTEVFPIVQCPKNVIKNDDNDFRFMCLSLMGKPGCRFLKPKKNNGDFWKFKAENETVFTSIIPEESTSTDWKLTKSYIEHSKKVYNLLNVRIQYKEWMNLKIVDWIINPHQHFIAPLYFRVWK